jgi:hypothetical protein
MLVAGLLWWAGTSWAAGWKINGRLKTWSFGAYVCNCSRRWVAVVSVIMTEKCTGQAVSHDESRCLFQVKRSSCGIGFKFWCRNIYISEFLRRFQCIVTSLLRNSMSSLFQICEYNFLRSRVLLGKLAGSLLVKKFTALYGTWSFITAFRGVRHLSRSWATSIQSLSPIPLPKDPS